MDFRLGNLRRLIAGEELETETVEGQEEEEEGAEEGAVETSEEETEQEEEQEEEGAEEAAASTSESAAEFQRGVTAERQRTATVLCSDEAASNMNLACNLLATDLSADEIKRILADEGKGNTTASRLKGIKTPSLRAQPEGEREEGDERDTAAADSRKKAVKSVNRNQPKGAKTTNANARVGRQKEPVS